MVVVGGHPKITSHEFHDFLYPSPVLVTFGQISETLYLVYVKYFAILHLEIIKLKQQFRNNFYFHLNYSYFSIKSTSNHSYENEQNINKIKHYDIILMNDKNLNILSAQTSNLLLYIIYNFYIFITI